MKSMTAKVFFVVQPYQRFGQRTKALRAVPANSESHAMRIAERLAEKGGAVAMAHHVDGDELERVATLGVFGDVPAEALSPS